MAKTKLLLEYDYDFLLIGIIARVPDYKLVWSLNKSLEIELSKENDMELPSFVKEQSAGLTLGFEDSPEKPQFSFYRFDNEDAHLFYTLISNRSKTSLLIKEEQSVDFFLIIGGMYDEIDVDQLLDKIRGDKMVMTAFEIDPNTLKSKQNLLFD